MIVTADEVNRSFRGTLDLLNSRAEGLKSFDMSERGFWRSFTAIWLTLPAYVVSLAFERLRLGLLQPDRSLLDNVWVDLVVALGHVAGFVALPVAMIWIARWFRLDEGLCALRDRDELDHGHRPAGALGAGHAHAARLGAAGARQPLQPRLRDHRRAAAMVRHQGDARPREPSGARHRRARHRAQCLRRHARCGACSVSPDNRRRSGRGPSDGAIGPQRLRSRASRAARTSSTDQRPAPARSSVPAIERT